MALLRWHETGEDEVSTIITSTITAQIKEEEWNPRFKLSFIALRGAQGFKYNIGSYFSRSAAEEAASFIATYIRLALT